MKRFFFLLSVLLPGLLFAKNISEEQARRVATAFWQSSPQTRGASAVSWQLVLQSENLPTRSVASAPAYYVYDNVSGPGFVIVAGDDVAMPVLGYSFENEFPSSDFLPVNVLEWLDGLREEINAARRESLKPSGVVARAWTSTSSGTPVVEMETALWDQDSPYNQLCPRINGIATYTGCTATAMAIVMRYHQWPVQGTGTLPAYTTDTYGQLVPAQELGHPYEWNLMPLDYTHSTTQQNQAVATLMRDCALALQSDFGPLGSSGTGAYITDIPVQLASHFGYSQTSRYVVRDAYTTTEWNDLMREELDASRPVLYSGHNPEGGHAFVLDGYDTESYFRVNWGWGGLCNGFYKLSALEPEEPGIGGSMGQYNEGQVAVIGVQREDGSEGVEELRFSYYDNRYGAASGGADSRIYNGLATDEPVRQNEPFELHIGFLYNSGTAAFTGQILVAVADKEGQIVEELYQFAAQELSVGFGFLIDQNVVVSQPIMPGYRIRAYYSSERTPDWTLVRGNDEGGCVWDLLLMDEYTIEQSTSFTYNKNDRMIRLTVKQGVTATLRDDAGTDYNSVCQADGTEITIDTAQLPAGSYILTLQKDSEEKELRFSVGENR